jgi:hypothetical protein
LTCGFHLWAGACDDMLYSIEGPWGGHSPQTPPQNVLVWGLGVSDGN